MEHLILKCHLIDAERHAADGERLLQRQRQIVAELERDRHENAAAQARQLLETLEETQRLHISDRDRLQEELRLATATDRTSG